MLGFSSEVVAKRCIVVGDPSRAKTISEMLDDVVRILKRREYYAYTGTYKGVKITVASHGVGSSGANVLFHELIEAGVSVIIRAGTCGSFGPRPRGSHIIATSAVRNDGASADLIPLAYPGSAHHEVIHALIEAAKVYGKEHQPYHCSVGVCSSCANLYSGPLKSKNALWREAKVIGEDMENSSLFTMGNLHSIKTGSIMTIDCDVFVEKQEEYNPFGHEMDQGILSMCQIALDAIITIDTEITSQIVFADEN